MRQMIIKRDTFLKNEEGQSHELSAWEKLPVDEKGWRPRVSYVEDAGDHWKVTVELYAFKEHVDFTMNEPEEPDDGERHVNNATINLIKEFEGFRGTAYRCPAGVWTIGYGHTKGVRPGQRISRPDALRLLREDVKVFERGVLKRVDVPLSDGQFGALVSFAYNVGLGAFGKSTLLRRLNYGLYNAVPDELRRWTRGGGRVLQGLVRRREAEIKLWRS